MLILLFFVLGALQPVSQEKYDNSVDYIGWQVMDAYMKDYTNLRTDRAAEQQGYKLFKEKFPSSAYSLENPPESEAVRQVLTNNSWSNAYKNLYSRIVNLKTMYKADWSQQQAADYLRNQIDNISLQSLGVEDSAYVNLQITKAQLRDEIAQFFSPSIEQSLAASDDSTPVMEENAEAETAYPQSLLTSLSNASEDTSWLGYQVNIISLILFLVLLGLLAYLFSMFKKTDERLDRHRKEINEINSAIFILKKKLSNSEKDDPLSDRLQALEKKVDKINLDDRRADGLQRPPTAAQAHSPVVAAPSQTEEFYLSTPNSDGTFNVSSMSPHYKPTASIYKFTVAVEDGESVASFTVAEQYESMKDALSSPGSYLDPVCESVNAFSPAAKRIVNLKPGRAIQQGGQWVVQPEDKALIRYE